MNFSSFELPTTGFDPFSGRGNTPFEFQRFDFHFNSDHVYLAPKAQVANMASVLETPPSTPSSHIPSSPPKSIEREDSGFRLGVQGEVQSIPKTGKPQLDFVDFSGAEKDHWALMESQLRGGAVPEFECSDGCEGSDGSNTVSKVSDVPKLELSSGVDTGSDPKPYADYVAPKTYVFSRFVFSKLFRLSPVTAVADVASWRMKRFLTTCDDRLAQLGSKTSFDELDKDFVRGVMGRLDKIERQLDKLQKRLDSRGGSQRTLAGREWLDHQRLRLKPIVVNMLMQDYNATKPSGQKELSPTDVVRHLVTNTAIYDSSLFDYYKMVLPRDSRQNLLLQDPIYLAGARYLFETALDVLDDPEALPQYIMSDYADDMPVLEDPAQIRVYLLAHYDGYTKYKLFSPDSPVLERLKANIEAAFNAKYETDWFTGRADEIVLGYNRETATFCLKDSGQIAAVKDLDELIHDEVGQVVRGEKRAVDLARFKPVIDRFSGAEAPDIVVWRFVSVAIKNHWPIGGGAMDWGINKVIHYLMARSLESVLEGGAIPNLSKQVERFGRLVHTDNSSNGYDGLASSFTDPFHLPTLESYVDAFQDLFSESFKDEVRNINYATELIKRFDEVTDSDAKFEDLESWVNGKAIVPIREDQEDFFRCLEARFCINVTIELGRIVQQDSLADDLLLRQIDYFARHGNAAMVIGLVQKLNTSATTGGLKDFCEAVFGHIDLLKVQLNQFVRGDMCDQLETFFSKESFEQSVSMGLGDSKAMMAAYDAVKELSLRLELRTTQGLHNLIATLKRVRSVYSDKEVRGIDYRIQLLENHLEMMSGPWPGRLLNRMLTRHGGRFELLEFGLQSITDPEDSFGKALLNFVKPIVKRTILGDRTKFLRDEKFEKKSFIHLQSYMSAFRHMTIHQTVKDELTDMMASLYYNALRSEFTDLLVSTLGVTDLSDIRKNLNLHTTKPISEAEVRYLWRMLKDVAPQVGVNDLSMTPQNDTQAWIIRGLTILAGRPWVRAFSPDALDEFYQDHNEIVGLDHGYPDQTLLNEPIINAFGAQLRVLDQEISEAIKRVEGFEEPVYKNERFRQIAGMRLDFESAIETTIGQTNDSSEIPDGESRVVVAGSDSKIAPTTIIDSKTFGGEQRKMAMQLFSFDPKHFTLPHQREFAPLKDAAIVELLGYVGIDTQAGTDIGDLDSDIKHCLANILTEMGLVDASNRLKVDIDSKHHRPLLNMLLERLGNDPGLVRSLLEAFHFKTTQGEKFKEPTQNVTGTGLKQPKVDPNEMAQFSIPLFHALERLGLIELSNEYSSNRQRYYGVAKPFSDEDLRAVVQELLKPTPAIINSQLMPTVFHEFGLKLKAGSKFEAPSSEAGKCLWQAFHVLGLFHDKTNQLARDIRPSDFKAIFDTMFELMRHRFNALVLQTAQTSGWLDSEGRWVADMQNPDVQTHVKTTFKKAFEAFVAEIGLAWMDVDGYLERLFLPIYNMQPDFKLSSKHFTESIGRLAVPVEGGAFFFKYNPVSSAERTVYMLSGFTDTPLVARSTLVSVTQRQDSLKQQALRPEAVSSVPATVSEGVVGIPIGVFYDPNHPERMTLLNKIIADNASNFTGNILLSMLTNPNDWNNGENLMVQIVVGAEKPIASVLRLDRLIDTLISGETPMKAAILGIDNDEALVPEVSLGEDGQHSCNVHNRLFFHSAMDAPLDKQTLELYASMDWETYLSDMVESLEWYQVQLDRMFDHQQPGILNVNFVPGHLREIKQKALKIQYFITEALRNWSEDPSHQMTPMDILSAAMPVTAAYYREARQIAAIMTLIRRKDAIGDQFKQAFGIDEMSFIDCGGSIKHENGVIFRKIQAKLQSEGAQTYRELLFKLSPPGVLFGAFDVVIRHNQIANDAIAYFYDPLPSMESVFAGREPSLKAGDRPVEQWFWSQGGHGLDLNQFDPQNRPVQFSPLVVERRLMQMQDVPPSPNLVKARLVLDGQDQVVDPDDQEALARLNLSSLTNADGKRTFKSYVQLFFHKSDRWREMYHDRLYESNDAPLFSVKTDRKKGNIPEITAIELIESKVNGRPFALRLYSGSVSFELDDYSPETRALLDTLNYIAQVESDPTSPETQRLFANFMAFTSAFVGRNDVGFVHKMRGLVLQKGNGEIRRALKEKPFSEIEWKWLVSLSASLKSLDPKDKQGFLQIILKKALSEWDDITAGAIYQIRGLYYDLYLFGQVEFGRDEFLKNVAGLSNLALKSNLSQARGALLVAKGTCSVLSDIQNSDSYPEIFQRIQRFVANEDQTGNELADTAILRFVAAFLLHDYACTSKDIKQELKRQSELRFSLDTHSLNNLEEAHHLFDEGVQSIARKYGDSECIETIWQDVTVKDALWGQLRGRQKLKEIDHLVALLDSANHGKIADAMAKAPKRLEAFRAYLAHQIIFYLDEWIGRHTPEDVCRIQAILTALQENRPFKPVDIGNSTTDPAGKVVLDHYDELPLERLMAIESLRQYIRQFTSRSDIEAPEMVHVDWSQSRGHVGRDIYERFITHTGFISDLTISSPSKLKIALSPRKSPDKISATPTNDLYPSVQGKMRNYFLGYDTLENVLKQLDLVNWHSKNVQGNMNILFQVISDEVESGVQAANSLEKLMAIVQRLNGLVADLSEKRKNAGQDAKIQLFVRDVDSFQERVKQGILEKYILEKFQGYFLPIKLAAETEVRGRPEKPDYLKHMANATDVQSLFFINLYDMDVSREQVLFYIEYNAWVSAIEQFPKNWKKIAKQFYRRFLEHSSDLSLNLSGQVELLQLQDRVVELIKLYFKDDGQVKKTCIPKGGTEVTPVTPELMFALMKDLLTLVKNDMNPKFLPMWDPRHKVRALNQFLFRYGLKAFPESERVRFLESDCSPSFKPYCPSHGNIYTPAVQPF